MLTKCPECDLPVSDKAIVCPHCGYPLDSKNKSTSKQSKSKSGHKRLPNGFGQISKIKTGNLRNRYRAMVTVGKTSDGKYIRKILKPQGYFSTYNKAYAALVEYNKNPYDLDSDLTVEELYKKWSSEYFNHLKSESSIRTITAAWKYCSSIYGMNIKNVRARHIKGCIDNGQIVVNGKPKLASPNIKARIKSLFNLLLDYALEYELVDRNYARTFSISDNIIDDVKQVRRGHIAFTDAEMYTLWKNIYVPYVDIILIQCYSGWRPGELGLIETKDVDFNIGTFKGGIKTDAGRNRVVPIHAKIKGLVKKYYDKAIKTGSKYLFTCTDGVTHKNSCMLTYDKYKTRFHKVISSLRLNPDHKPHDPRVQFITMMKNAGADEYAIKYIVGHSIDDITEKIYTKRTVDWLIQEVGKIK